MSECNILSVANNQRILHHFLCSLNLYAYTFKEALKLDSLHFIKSCTNVFIFFGGSGGEIMLCKNLQQKWIACELQPYYKMILDRLANNGRIKDEFKINLSYKPNLEKKRSKFI